MKSLQHDWATAISMLADAPEVSVRCRTASQNIIEIEPRALSLLSLQQQAMRTERATQLARELAAAEGISVVFYNHGRYYLQRADGELDELDEYTEWELID